MLYTIIQVNPNILELIDGVPFIDTPLHIAAFHGKIPFAKEIMRLKPSFARKLNPQGFSPIHLALSNGQTNMVMRFLDGETDLVRVQGREDVTIHGETALHIAVKKRQVDALDVLVGGLLRACYKGCSVDEKVIMNWKDEEGKTALHIATATNQFQAVKLLLDSGIDVNAKDEEGTTALHIATVTNQPQVVKLLVKSGINVNAKNSDGLTALDMLEPHNKQVEEILLHARALKAYSLPSQVKANSYYHLKSKLSFKERRKTEMIRLRNNVNNDTRDVILVVATLIVTATYQSSLSPPGGLWQEVNSSTGVNNMSHAISTASTNTTTSTTTEYHSAGTVIMPTASFFSFYLVNSLTLLTATLVIIFLLPSDQMSWLITLPLYLFSLCYMFSWQIISPALGSVYVIAVWLIIYSLACIWVILQSKHSRKIENQNSS
ncbi:hypothetical protein FNV43_RR08955 [Rhamnella rubrinervis]|uniref:PGG domain-containing protein n=1 Tax=Rhamnella rubrinervis TaxID=2594499 RepID=A0A8K0H984_9ROSA|nr:hypothetical protein FNV43_RR08955 [Rhamnella rubrinervis]